MEWQQAAEKVSMQHYQHYIDALEGLVVARMFELTKMNMSQTGKFPHILSIHLGNSMGWGNPSGLQVGVSMGWGMG